MMQKILHPSLIFNPFRYFRNQILKPVIAIALVIDKDQEKKTRLTKIVAFWANSTQWSAVDNALDCVEDHRTVYRRLSPDWDDFWHLRHLGLQRASSPYLPSKSHLNAIFDPLSVKLAICSFEFISTDHHRYFCIFLVWFSYNTFLVSAWFVLCCFDFPFTSLDNSIFSWLRNSYAWS